MSTALDISSTHAADVAGEFVDFAGERYYVIRNVDKMAPFFISVISNVDHWLFVSSSGGLTAGRVSPETALFPYVTVDKIHESLPHTGPKTMLRVAIDGKNSVWEPFNREHDGRFAISRHLYKNVLGNKLCFEEVNHDLQLEFRYTWATSEAHGFVRQCELHNSGSNEVIVDLIDGLLNILPAGTPRIAQSNSSNLVDAYKWTELDERRGMALYTLYSGITDRAEPCESLRANVVYCLGLNAPRVLISNKQLDDFRRGGTPHQEVHKRGIRGSYFVNHTLNLAARATQRWQIVADIERSQSQVIALAQELDNPANLAESIHVSVAAGTDGLARIMARCDGFQATSEENVSVHHYANVLFNVLRGGYFYDQYNVPSRDFAKTIECFNRNVYTANHDFLRSLPPELPYTELLARIEAQGDMQLA
ncbi:MAG: hypothetical protein KJO82_15085, partial [Gammaproteobacteria bacterium]|nr:hypothetical protein [Gammaproteobacteria bacterium]